MTYQEWLNGGGCGCNDTPKPITGGCDCNDIILQISMLDTDVDMLSDAFDVLDDKVDDIVVPTNVSAFNNDAGYLTEHQPLKTINGQVISGTGNIVIEGGGTAIDIDSELSLSSTNPVENKVITEALNGKLDASAYTPTDLSEYWTSAQTNNAINAAVSGKADASAVYTKSEVDTAISAATADMATKTWVGQQGYQTSGDVQTAISGKADSSAVYTKQEVDNKFWCGTQSEYDALVSSGLTSNNVLYLIHE